MSLAFPIRTRPRPFDTVLTDADGRQSLVAVLRPERVTATTGVLIGLHGAGGSGAGFLPWIAPLAERANLVVVCPTASAPPEGSSNLDLAGLMGRRFAHPRWQADASDFPMLALDWAIRTQGVNPRRAVILGYSMGAVAAWGLALRYTNRFAGLVAISGAVSMWERFGRDARTEALLPNLLGLPICAVHGREDEQFPPALLDHTARRLRALGHDRLTERVIDGAGHGLASLELRPGAEDFDALGRWLADLPARTTLKGDGHAEPA